MSFDPVNDADIEAGKPTKQEIFKKTKDNQDDHEGRLSDLEATQSVQTLVGEVRQYAGGVAPAGWLLCDGSAVSRATYSDLFAVLGTSYGVGDGSTTFNLPDGRGATFVGVNNSGLPNGENVSFSTRNRGDSGGSENTTLTVGMLPSHNHDLSNHTHNTLYHGSGISLLSAQYPGSSDGILAGNQYPTAGPDTNISGNTGSGDDTPIMQPFFVGNYLIKT